MADFFDQFGELDESKRVVLQIILEEIYGIKKTIPVLGETRQVGHSSTGDISGEDVSGNKSQESR